MGDIQLPSNPIAAVVIVLIVVLFGWAGRGFLLAWSKERRSAEKDDVDLTGLVQKVASDTISGLRVEMKQMRDDRRREMEQVRAERRRDRSQIAELQEQLAEYRTQLEDLQVRFQALGRDLANKNALLRSAITYAHALLGYISEHLPERTDVPLMPGELEDYSEPPRRG